MAWSLGLRRWYVTESITMIAVAITIMVLDDESAVVDEAEAV